jgi:GNAT superfamily N-acetyltransferase
MPITAGTLAPVADRANGGNGRTRREVSRAVDVRLATADDLPHVATLIDAGMVELYRRRWGGTVARLAADLAAGRLAIAIAGDAGYIAWQPAYDIHHAIRGGEVDELYVAPARRGHGVAAQLVAFACGEIARDGGAFLRGTAVASAAPLYDRVASGWDCREVCLGGKAFRTFAALAGASARAIVRGLPDPAWNHGD